MKKLSLKQKQVITLTAIIAIAISACNFVAKPKGVVPTGNTTKGQGDSQENAENEVVEEADNMGQVVENTKGEAVDETKTPTDKTSEDIQNSKTNTYTGKPLKTGSKRPGNTDLNKNDNEDDASTALDRSEYLTDAALQDEWGALDAIAEAGQSYYTENFSKTRLITKNGYLYNKASEELIDIRYLVANGYLESRYIGVDAEVLLLDCADFKNYEEFSIKSWESGLAVFSAMKHPSENVYLLTTSKSSGGGISAAQYAALMNGYYQNHGNIGRLYLGSEEYSRILSFVSMYESKYEDYYVRSITTDNKYAMVVLSGENNVADVKQYVLKRNGSIWEVVAAGLESDPRVLITVNKLLPDYNIDMIPDYTINDFRGKLDKDKYELTAEMIARGMILSTEDIKYIAGTTNFCYIVLKNEIKYICNYTGERWNIVQVANSGEAEKKMLAISKTAPTFIILDR